MNRRYFNTESHQYFDGETRYPGVTEVLSAEGLYKGVDFFTPESRQIGDWIHKVCEWWELGTLDEETLDPLLAGYLASWKAFIAHTGFVSLLIEKQLWSRIYRFAGTMDRFGKIDEQPTLIDLKHGAYQEVFALQTAGYHLLLNESDIMKELSDKKVKRMSVTLAADGALPYVKEHKENSDYAMFLAALAVLNWKRRYGLL